MNHENRWSFWKNSDAAWGDHMRFVAEMPEFRAKDGLFAVFCPVLATLLSPSPQRDWIVFSGESQSENHQHSRRTQ